MVAGSSPFTEIRTEKKISAETQQGFRGSAIGVRPKTCKFSAENFG